MTGSALSTVQQVELSGYRLDESGIARLLKLLDGGGPADCALPLLEHVLRLGAVYVVQEDPYTDQDYSADFVSFYASAFKTYPRHTKRLHFFARDVACFLDLCISEQAEAFGKEGSYLGFTVVRPLSQGPIGRTLLPFPKLTDGLTVRMAARSKTRLHLMAAEMKIEGAPFIQQDSRVGACAQAAIWMASRPLHERHGRSGWHPMSEITRLAITPTDPEVSTSLPHGSSGLSPIHIIRALRAMGHQPYTATFVREMDGTSEACGCNGGRSPQAPDVESNSEQTAETATLVTACPTVTRYLDSGLPVILGLAEISSRHQVGHAVTAVGYVEADAGSVRSGEGYDAFLRAFLIHDDQRGPYRLMPLSAEDVEHLPSDQLLRIDGDVIIAEEMVTHIFVPLSPRLSLSADKADVLAGDFIEQCISWLGESGAEQVAHLGRDEYNSFKEFVDAWSDGRLVRRTYLTTAGRYRHHLAQTKLDEDVKVLAVTRKLPHFIWVTELLYAGTGQEVPGGERMIVGHIVTNATGSTDLDADLLFAHLPFFLLQRDVDPPRGYDGEYLEKGTVVFEHAPYAQRVRR